MEMKTGAVRRPFFIRSTFVTTEHPPDAGDRMTASNPKPVTIVVDKTKRVSGLLLQPPKASAVYVFAHGAGAGMAHPFMAAVATELVPRGIATLRYQFPYMEAGGKRPDP